MSFTGSCRPWRVRRHTLLPRHQLVEQQQDRCRGVDGHRGGDLVEREVSQQEAHVGQRVDGHAHLADFAFRPGVVGVEAHLGGQVEGARQSGLPGGEQELETLVGVLGGAEPGVLAHGPQPAPVHARVDAAGVRRRPRCAELLLGVPPRQVAGTVERPYFDPRARAAHVVTGASRRFGPARTLARLFLRHLFGLRTGRERNGHSPPSLSATRAARRGRTPCPSAARRMRPASVRRLPPRRPPVGASRGACTGRRTRR